MITQVHNPASGKLRVIGYSSGSGNTLWKVWELQQEMEATPGGCPFEIVGVFSDNPNSKAMDVAGKLGLPHVALDICEYYAKRDKPMKDRAVRAEYDAEVLELIRPMKADMILLAGYVWATTDQVLDEYLMVNVHPADLSVMKDGKRAFAGANGVRDTLNAGAATIAATAHLATKELDGGPILVVSEQIPIDYTLHDDETERMRYYLKLVNEQNRLAGTRAVLEIALGHFGQDDNGLVYHNGVPMPTGIHIESWEQNKPLYARKTEKLLLPESVAVIGASQKPGIGNAVVQNLLRDGYEGALYAINVRGEDVGGARGYKSVLDVEGPVDLAVIAIPSAGVLQVAEECGKKGVHALICITAGFQEVGGEGVAAQQKLVDIVNRYNMRMIGPNCSGVLHVASKLNATMFPNAIAAGNVGFVSQSGAIGAAILDYADELGMGFSSMVTLGNQSDITVCDILPFFEEDDNTRVIVLYLESILEPTRLWKIASKMTKPILLLKSGRTAAGMAAASSHTGSLAGNDQVVDAIIQKAGIQRMGSLEECFAVASALANMPPVQGNRVGVLTNAGGPGILISDALSDLGFDIPRPSDKLTALLRPNLLKEASVNNPIDLVAPAPPEHYALAAKAMLESGEFDALLICCVPPATIDTAKVAEALAPVVKGAGIPVLSSFFGPTIGQEARVVMRKNGIPATQYPEQIATMLAGMRPRSGATETAVARPSLTTVNSAKEILTRVEPGQYLPINDAYALLRSFGVDVAQDALLKSAEDARSAPLRYPVVAKIDHPDIVHKSDVGGVRVGIADADELADVTADFLTRFPGANGVFVQEMVPDGLELIVGSVRDDKLGHSVMLGLGGVWVEVMKDVAFGYPPIGEEEALRLIDSLRCAPLLAGYRGKNATNKLALARLIQRVGAMLLAVPGIAELDLNPVIYDPAKDAFVAADARIKRA